MFPCCHTWRLSNGGSKGSGLSTINLTTFSPIIFGYAVVKVEMVMDHAEDIVLVPPPNDEISTLGQAILQRIQWKRSCIVVKRTSVDPPKRVARHSSSQLPQPPRKDSRKSPSGAALSAIPSPAGPTKSAPILPAIQAAAAKSSEMSV